LNGLFNQSAEGLETDGDIRRSVSIRDDGKIFRDTKELFLFDYRGCEVGRGGGESQRHGWEVLVVYTLVGASVEGPSIVESLPVQVP
jgi:hypothetical protein